MQVIHAVRKHFAAKQQPLRVVLVLEEAGALGLVTPFVLSALQELRKAGLAIHRISQSAADFGGRSLFEAVAANAPWQAFYQLLSPGDQELAAKTLANASFDAHAVHFTRTRTLQDGVERTETVSEGESFGQGSHANVRHDRRKGTAFRVRYKHVVEPAYKSPQLFEQEMRTALATLCVGERFVRDRGGVRRERVRPVRFPMGGASRTAPRTRYSSVFAAALPTSRVRLPCRRRAPRHTPTPPHASGREGQWIARHEKR